MTQASTHRADGIPGPRPAPEVRTTHAEPGTPPPRLSVGRLPGRVEAWVVGGVPALLMLVVGRWGLRHPSLGWDENATWLVSRRTVAQILKQAGHTDGVIAPYYLFMHGWTAVFGDSELALRAPSLIAVAAGVGLTGLLGRRLFGPGVGLLGGVFLVAVPQLSRYAQDARVYGITFALAALATVLLYRAVERPSPPRWIGYAAAVALLGMSHVVALLVLAGHGYAVLSRWWAWRDRALLRWAYAAGAALVPVLPVLWLGLTQRGHQLEWLPPITPGQVLRAPGDIAGAAATGLLLSGLALAARRADRLVLRDLIVLVVLPPAALIGISFVSSPLWIPRYALFVLPFLCLLAAIAVRGRPVYAALALLLLVGVGLPAQARVRGPASHHGPNFRAAGLIIARQLQPGDGIVYGRHGTWSLRAGIDYQLGDRQRPRDLLVTTPAAVLGRLDSGECANRVACLGGTARVWFFRQGGTGAPADDAGPLTGALDAGYRPVRVWRVGKGTVALFQRR